jgi:hypothetical protein
LKKDIMLSVAPTCLLAKAGRSEKPETSDEERGTRNERGLVAHSGKPKLIRVLMSMLTKVPHLNTEYSILNTNYSILNTNFAQ